MRPCTCRRGFTLLELLVVLLLTALVTGLAVPNAQRWLSGARERVWRAELRDALRALPTAARQQGDDLVVDVDALRRRVPGLPADVLLRLDAPLRYRANGVAVAGRLDIVRPGQPVESWQVLSLTGDFVRL
jgi:prepilin-type N-terminal cleavage/methylation domain-containing protein